MDALTVYFQEANGRMKLEYLIATVFIIMLLAMSFGAFMADGQAVSQPKKGQRKQVGTAQKARRRSARIRARSGGKKKSRQMMPGTEGIDGDAGTVGGSVPGAMGGAGGSIGGGGQSSTSSDETTSDEE